MRWKPLARLLAGVFASLTLVSAASVYPADVSIGSANRGGISSRLAPRANAQKSTPPLCRLYYTHADELIGSGLTADEFRACGFDAILTSGDHFLRYQWLEFPLTEATVRADLEPVIRAADGMPLWLELGVTTQAGSPRPTSPARTFYDPRDQAHRAMALANLQLISQIALEYGITRIGFDWEAYSVSDARYVYPAPQARQIGADLAAAARAGNPQAQLFGFCPVSFYSTIPGFRALVRGYYHGQPAGVLLDEDLYGMQGSVPRVLQRDRALTQARECGAGWFASDRAAAGPAWYGQCGPQLQRAMSVCPVLMVYHEGDPLYRAEPQWEAALGKALLALH